LTLSGTGGDWYTAPAMCTVSHSFALPNCFSAFFSFFQAQTGLGGGSGQACQAQ
jgi:hypothetical protein